MAAPKGNKFARPRTGSKNKKTIEWETFSKYCLEGGLERFKCELETLEGRDYVESFLKLLEFHKPKLARTEVSAGQGQMMILLDLPLSNFKINELTIPPRITDTVEAEEGEIIKIN